jgi:hypothetical protein
MKKEKEKEIRLGDRSRVTERFSNMRVSRMSKLGLTKSGSRRHFQCRMAIQFVFLSRSPTRIQPQKTLDFILTLNFTALSIGAKIESVAAKSAS